MRKTSRREFMKYGFMTVATTCVALAPIKFDISSGFTSKESKLPTITSAEAHAMCGVGMGCGGGGGMCGMGMSCSGQDSGRCGMGLGCGGGGGRCGIGIGCSGG